MTLSEALARRDALIRELDQLLPVVAIDVDDVYNDDAMAIFLHLEGGSVPQDWRKSPRGRTMRKFAECLVDRMITSGPDPGLVLDWRP